MGNLLIRVLPATFPSFYAGLPANYRVSTSASSSAARTASDPRPLRAVINRALSEGGNSAVLSGSGTESFLRERPLQGFSRLKKLTSPPLPFRRGIKGNQKISGRVRKWSGKLYYQLH